MSSVVFAGTSTFAVPSLKALLDDPSFQITLVITQPDKSVGRKKELTASPVKTFALEKGIPVFQPKNLSKEWMSRTELAKHSFDFLVVASYGQILTQDVLDLPNIAPVNVHASLLPRGRGASPIQHTILAGDQETGVTIQKMVRDLDAGPILAQEKLPIDPRETSVTLSESLCTLGAELLVKTLKAPLIEKTQDASQVTRCRKLTRADGLVDPKKETAEEVDRKVRALNPWPSVTVKIGKEELKLLETSLTAEAETAEFLCANGTKLYFVTVQTPGKKPMTGAAWARGKRYT